ncbi:unnamed protein product [marine sediment metagenome]|uniref:Uncharacterized protein n=1 Tax=marine sediment metagenome TaxID=412755 RepID=X1CDT5_9ZZZZ
MFFGVIAKNGIDHNDHLDKFEIKCKDAGGIMFVPKGAKGWPQPECRNPNAMISINVREGDSNE